MWLFRQRKVCISTSVGECPQIQILRPLPSSSFQKRLRNLTPAEVDGFLKGDAAASDMASDGEEKPVALPLPQILEPDGLLIGTNSLLRVTNNYDDRPYDF